MYNGRPHNRNGFGNGRRNNNGRGGNGRRPNQGAGQHTHEIGHSHSPGIHYHPAEMQNNPSNTGWNWYGGAGSAGSIGEAYSSTGSFQTNRSGRHQHTGQIGGRRTMGSRNNRRGRRGRY